MCQLLIPNFNSHRLPQVTIKPYYQSYGRENTSKQDHQYSEAFRMIFQMDPTVK